MTTIQSRNVVPVKLLDDNHRVRTEMQELVSDDKFPDSLLMVSRADTKDEGPRR